MATSGSQRSSGRNYNRRSTGTTSKTRNGSSDRSSSSDRNNHNDSSAQRKEVDAKIQQEAVALIVFGVVLMVFLCMVNVIKGSFGPAVKSFMLGAFGVLGYLIPVAVFVGICFKISNAANQVATLKLISALVLFFMAGILLCYITGMDIAYLSGVEDRIRQLYDLQGGGGVIFGLTACWLYGVFGQAGSIFLAVVLALICIMIITERSFLGKLKLRDKFPFGSASDDAASYDNISYDDGSYDDALYDSKSHDSKSHDSLSYDSLSYDNRYTEEDNGQYGLATVDGKRRESSSALPVVYGNRSNARERARNTALERAKEQQRRREEAKQRRRELEEQREDERIATAHSVHNARKNKLDIDQVLIEDQKQKAHHDDIHEIVLLEEPADKERKRPQPESSGSAMREITISRGEEPEETVPDGELPEIDESAVDALYAEDTPAESYAAAGGKLSKNDTDEESQAEDEEPEAEETVVAAPDLSQMPQPVTERSHQDVKTTESPNPSQTPKTPVKPRKYEKPKLSLLKKNENKKRGDSDQELKETALLLQQTLKTFGVTVTVTNISQGPSVTRYELQLGEGIKVNKIVSLTDDIKLNLAAQDIRIEAPIPGKAAVGIELPNKKTSDVLIRDLIESSEYKNASSNLTFAVGKDITGKTIVADIAKMPHMLVAGATGSGKSVCINTLIMSILYKAHPDDVKLIMIDPKVVELSVYNGIPHLLIPVVTDPRKANAALQWAVAEMTKRYKAFADFGLRDLKGYNKKVEDLQAKGEGAELLKMPQIIVIVDELADLMMVASKEVEESICRLAQLARAAGIHLVIATQRPSVDVITGLIKANMPSRVAFKVTSGVDSRTILDMIGAEKLLGKGDMLFYPQGYSKPLRVQGAFVSDQEVSDVVDFLKKNAGDQAYDAAVEQQISGMSEGDGAQDAAALKGGSGAEDSLDAYFDEACRFVVEKEKASSGMLQRVFKVGYTRAARIVDQMEAAGVVGPEEGTKPRKVLMNSAQLEEFLHNKNA